MSRRASFTRLLGAGALLAASNQAQANPLDAFGWGARAPALGNAYAAVADDSSASYYNPAGLARAQGLRIDIGYQVASPRLDVSGVRQELFDTRGVQAGLVLPGQIRSVRFAIGVQLFLPDLHVTRIHVLQHDRPRLQLYDNRTQRLFLAANLSLRIVRGLYIGGGLAFLLFLFIVWFVLAGVRDPRGIATSNAAGIASVKSWCASADAKQIVESGRRVAASIQSQSAAGASTGR